MLNSKELTSLHGSYDVILAESCPVTRLGLRLAISLMPLQIKRIEETGQLTEIPKLITQHRPDVIITELAGDGDSVLDALRSISHCIRYWQPQIPVVVCTAIQNAPLFQLLRAINVRGICLKQEPIETLTHCVERALQDCTAFSPMASQYLPETQGYYSPLTEKELEVLVHLFSGKNVTAVAKLMNRDIRTISTHKRNAMRKVGFKSDSEMFSNSNWMALDSCNT
ncbi:MULTISPECIES: response regulator transcription factor [unclassified Serratia (in: enterobacteria)]|uniref:response regulator transcription factor n=1 Tax=unclassified Serratia (in: enterobacteria) TaxID=2647522 RepID=UPI003075F482